MNHCGKSVIVNSTPLARVAAVLFVAAALLVSALSPARGQLVDQEQSRTTKPTIVLVHGAWADASSWTNVIRRLQKDGYTVRAIPNPLRSLSGDGGYVRTFLETVSGPVVLVGHSYGGAVITNAATGVPNVQALVYVNGFAPDEGENAFELGGADSALAVPDPTTVFKLVPGDLPPTPETDLYLKKKTVFESFASFSPELSRKEKTLVWATQRPATVGALTEPSGVPAWKTIPSWALVGVHDEIIPASSLLSMAERAGAKIRKYDAGHLGLMSDPATVARGIERAARAVAR
jgi:pimeloyl-ACP methyl ester carboxylesterase